MYIELNQGIPSDNLIRQLLKRPALLEKAVKLYNLGKTREIRIANLREIKKNRILESSWEEESISSD